ncbi:MAG: ribbon-helix-helix domain-containing protein [Candidatus Sigynarchaeota archaeon]
MKMITLFLPEKYLEMLDTLVASNLYPNRSEALRMATWKFLHESVAMLKAVPATTASRSKQPVANAKNEPAPTSTPESILASPADLDEILDEIDSDKATATEGDPKVDPFDEIVREQQHA